MHWCANETMAVMAMIPVLGYIFRKLQVWYHDKYHKSDPCPCDHCEECEEESLNWVQDNPK